MLNASGCMYTEIFVLPAVVDGQEVLGDTAVAGSIINCFDICAIVLE